MASATVDAVLFGNVADFFSCSQCLVEEIVGSARRSQGLIAAGDD